MWFPSQTWRGHARAAEAQALETAATRRAPTPAPERLVRVVAITANWRMDGEPVEAGRTYKVPLTEAGVLEYAGKARRA